jgi:hypothetical protein
MTALSFIVGPHSIIETVHYFISSAGTIFTAIEQTTGGACNCFARTTGSGNTIFHVALLVAVATVDRAILGVKRARGNVIINQDVLSNKSAAIHHPCAKFSPAATADRPSCNRPTIDSVREWPLCPWCPLFTWGIDY